MSILFTLTTVRTYDSWEAVQDDLLAMEWPLEDDTLDALKRGEETAIKETDWDGQTTITRAKGVEMYDPLGGEE